MSVAAARLKALGVPAFAGSDPATAARELQWFATTSWNAGLAASVELGHDWASAARLFAAAGMFMDAGDVPPYNAADGGDAAHASAAPSRRLAWLLAAGAALEVHSATVKHDAEAAVVLGEAQHALARCAAAAEAAGAHAHDAGRTDIFFALLSFTASTRAGDEAGSMAVLRKAESLPGLTADTALKLARLASTAAAASDSGSLVALRAYELCLRVMQRSPGASLKDISYVLRKVVTLAEQAGGATHGSDNRDVRLLRAFRDATSVLASSPPGAYPSEEAAWLVTTAWNRGALLAKLGRPESAEVRCRDSALRLALRADFDVPSQPLLKCGLELLKHGAKHAPALEEHKELMKGTLVRARAHVRCRCATHLRAPAAGCDSAEEARRPRPGCDPRRGRRPHRAGLTTAKRNLFIERSVQASQDVTLSAAATPKPRRCGLARFQNAATRRLAGTPCTPLPSSLQCRSAAGWSRRRER